MGSVPLALFPLSGHVSGHRPPYGRLDCGSIMPDWWFRKEIHCRLPMSAVVAQTRGSYPRIEACWNIQTDQIQTGTLNVNQSMFKCERCWSLDVGASSSVISWTRNAASSSAGTHSHSSWQTGWLKLWRSAFPRKAAQFHELPVIAANFEVLRRQNQLFTTPRAQ